MMIKYTRLCSTDRQDLSKVIPLAKPFTIIIEPSSFCNFKCLQCFHSLAPERQRYFKNSKGNMPIDAYQKIIEQLRRWPGEKFKVLKLSLYGEPLMNPDFVKMLQIAKDADIFERIETTTNASLLDKDIAEGLVEFGLDYLRVSIYSVYQEKHEKITRNPLNISVIKRNLEYLLNRRNTIGSEKPFISPKMLDSYSEENEIFLNEFESLGDEVYIDEPHSWTLSDNSDFLKKYYKTKRKKIVAHLRNHRTEREVCPMPFTTMAIRCNGDISPCCVDFNGGTNIGNIQGKTLPELWRSKEWVEFQCMQLQRRQKENTSCRSCLMYKSNHYTKDNIDNVPVSQILPR